MSYFSQIVGLAVQNFLAGAAGLAVGIAFIRGLARERTTGLGNFWVDLTRATLWVLLPLALLGGLLLVWQGVPANVKPYQVVPLVQATSYQQPRTDINGHPVTDTSGNALPDDQVTQQIIPRGPVAALESSKTWAPTAAVSLTPMRASSETDAPDEPLEMLAIAVLPAALTHTFGRMIGRRHRWVLFAVMVVLFSAGLALCDWAEQAGNPRLDQASNVEQHVTDGQPGGNMEGKETRFGIGGSVLTAITTSNGATGSYNSMHDSYTPMGGMIPLVNMLLGEVIFGGLGTGLYSIILVALIGLFAGGLMVGRTPEYLGKQIGPTEMKLISLYILLGPATILLLTALAVVTDWGTAGVDTNSGPHGLSGLCSPTPAPWRTTARISPTSVPTRPSTISRRLRDDGGPVWIGAAGVGASGASGVPAPPPGGARDHANGYAALCWPGDRDDLHCGRPELFPSPGPGASGRASAARAVSRSTTRSTLHCAEAGQTHHKSARPNFAEILRPQGLVLTLP